MTDGPGADVGDRAGSSREPSQARDRRQDRHAESSGAPYGDAAERGPFDVPEGGADPTGAQDPAGPDAGAVPGGTILTDAAALAAERDEYLGALQRLQADFENYRKRVLRQQEEQSARAALDLVGKILPVLDTLDLARAHLGGASGTGASEEARALDQARAQLLDVLAKEGLERVDEAEVEFDPVVHDAVAHAPAEPAEPAGTAGPAEGSEPAEPTGQADAAGPGTAAPGAGGVTVDEVLRAGYRWRGHVLRPAMVRVRG